MSDEALGHKSQQTDYDSRSESKEALFTRFGSSEKGLSEDAAQRLLKEYGPNEVSSSKKKGIAMEILSRFANPLVIVLLIVAFFSYALGDKTEATYVSTGFIVLMALVSVFLSYFQEYRAGKEAEKLKEMVHTKATVYRDGKPGEIDIKRIVPGDIVEVSAGDMFPADIRLITSKDLFVDQSALTGESFPAEKSSESLKAGTASPAERTNIAFMGSTVVSGTGLGIVIKTGQYTEFGAVSKQLNETQVETSFDKGIKNFTWLMIKFMLVLVLLVFVINAALKGNFTEALLFSLAVAVGLTPEMLPMLVTVNLSKGAIAMAKKKVIVKHLNAIQNFGAMDTLCTDKTGTLTLNEIVLEKHVDVMGAENDDVLRYAYINSFYQTGLKNLLDQAILKHGTLIIKEFSKISEIPYDFERRIMSVIVESAGKRLIVSKGAEEEIFKRCDRYVLAGETKKLEPADQKKFLEEVNKLQNDGFRVLAVAYKDIEVKGAYSKDDEKGLILKGYVSFLDPPKPGVKSAIDALRASGIETIVLTGDNELVTGKICRDIGLEVKTIVTGDQVEKADENGLKSLVKTSNIFARLNPVQKKRIITALRANGHIVGYLGDGINDAPSLKAADVGISVNNAVDVAKESADIILLEKDLMVLNVGVVEGRKIFGNILKYIKMSSSSNFGNMFSMIGASIFLPFLPMAPVQILLNNFLYDMSQIAIPTDSVDSEYTDKPRPWNVEYIKKFMIIIGPISSIFDYITFAVMWFIFAGYTQTAEAIVLFHTGWFIESLCSQTLVVYVIRTGKNPLKSKPSTALIFTTLAIIMIGAIIIPFSPLAEPFGFVKPPIQYYEILVGMLAAYLLMVQVVKTWFIKKYGYE